MAFLVDKSDTVGRRFGWVLVAGSLVVGSCGFHPMLATRDDGGPSVAGDLAGVRIGYIESRSGQVLRNDLVEALNPRGEPQHAKYSLAIRIEEPQQNLAYQRTNAVTNVSYGVIAYWTLLDENGKTIFSSNSSSSQQYENSNSQYATTVSAQNVRDRIMVDISNDIRNKLAQYFNSQK